MLKKRIIFTLLYDSGFFMLSRNFRLQRVGNLSWLKENYNFAHIAFFIDELVVLDVTRKNRDIDKFCEILKELTAGCFVPIAAGGGVRTLEHAQKLFRSGADKIVVNTPLFNDPAFVKILTKEYGQQSIVGSVDMRCEDDLSYRIFTSSGTLEIQDSPALALAWLCDQMVGELYLNSINQDGTGRGYDFGMLDQLPEDCEIPVIIAGGVGNGGHLAVGFNDVRVDAVATAHLFNFVGDGLQLAREELIAQGKNVAFWPRIDFLPERLLL